jgi:hypothetical protein
MKFRNVVQYGAAMAVIVLCSTTGIANAQTGRCYDLKDVVRAKSWDSIKYKYSPQYIIDHEADLNKLVNGGY